MANFILENITSLGGMPIVLKPISSSHSEGVYFCKNKEDIVSNFSNIINHRDFYGNENTSVLAQKQLDGPEYVVNAVSYDGLHCITDVWTNHKKQIDKQYVYDYQELVLQEDPRLTAIKPYVYKVLDALSIRYGASHSEIILTNKKRPLPNNTRYGVILWRSLKFRKRLSYGLYERRFLSKVY